MSRNVGKNKNVDKQDRIIRPCAGIVELNINQKRPWFLIKNFHAKSHHTKSTFFHLCKKFGG